jgi:hypothetical protein
MLEVNFSLWFTCNCWKISPWIQEEFSLFPRESSRIGHACVDILEMTGCCLHLPENFMYAHQATNWFIQEREKNSRTFTIFFHVLLTRTQLCFIAISSCWCNCLLAIAILLVFLELYTVSWESNILTSLTSTKIFHPDILNLKYDSI